MRERERERQQWIKRRTGACSTIKGNKQKNWLRQTQRSDLLQMQRYCKEVLVE